MKQLFNENWLFSELSIDQTSMYNEEKPILFLPNDFYSKAESLDYKEILLPHDWMISNTKALYRNSVGFYKKQFELTEGQVQNKHNAIRFEGVYMNSAVWINGKLAGTWKYGYATFEFDISDLVKVGTNEILVIAAYQNCNTRWYSGAGIFRDVHFISTEKTFLVSDGTYIVNRKVDDSDNSNWTTEISAEIAGQIDGHYVKTTIATKDGKVIAKSSQKIIPQSYSIEETEYLHKTVCGIKNYELSKTTETFNIENPILWDIENPHFYIAKTELFDKNDKLIDCFTEHCGYKSFYFDKNNGFFLNGRHVKIFGTCEHHDFGALGSAFYKNALKRRFTKLKKMGVNAIRCSHNPPAKDWMNLADEMGLLIDDEAFDMWEKPKTQFDYGNYFNEWHERDAVSWVRRDRNHPSLIMWSIGNEIYDTHIGNGLEITKTLSKIVRKHDPQKNALITLASNYMMTDGAQECAKEIEVVGYNYLERLYDEHHKKYPEWNIYGSETSSTVQSRGIYHFPQNLTLVTFDDGQCSALANCVVPWGAKSSIHTITIDRDTTFSAGQFIWTGWDYIGEPTPYHTKNSYFGQIDTAGFEKDSFYMYKGEWTNYKTNPFVHIFPYWDFNEGQLIDIRVHSNAPKIKLFLNEQLLGTKEINHKTDKEPYLQVQVPYQKGELKAIAYDENDKEIAIDSKHSFEDPTAVILEPETEDYDNLFFIHAKTVDKNGFLVENARNYVTINVSGDAELVGMDNGDSTDYEEYVSKDGKNHTRKLFSNRVLAIVRAKSKDSKFTVTAASKDLKSDAISYNGKSFAKIEPDNSIKPEKDYIPIRNILISVDGNKNLTANNKEVLATAKVLPENASTKDIYWTVVLKESVPTDYIKVCDIQKKGTGTECATLKAVCDGECRLRVCAKNDSELPQVISDLEFSVGGVGNPKFNPYKLVEALKHTEYDKAENKQKPEPSLLGGISTRSTGKTWISFDKVDFGTEGADTIHIPIFSFDEELPFEIWQGNPNEKDSECLLKATYKAKSIYNTYTENVYTLPKRLFGVQKLGFAFTTGLYFQGFYFDQTKKALSKLRALDANVVAGDSFTKTQKAVEHIGNNVNLDFENMDFGEQGATKITICGKSNTENNSINIKFFDKDGNSTTQLIEFAHTDSYQEKTFNLEKIAGKGKISFVFLPGCNFDFEWFKFW